MNDTTLPLIPKPLKIERRADALDWAPGVRPVLVPAPELAGSAAWLAREMTARHGVQPVLAASAARGPSIRLDTDGAPDYPDPEAYRLTVSADGVHIRARTAVGAARAAQTLLQLMPPDGGAVPGVEIEDWPRFRWRGLMLDCARHFMRKEEILHYLDIMAFHKLNVFHWHFIDDQGWRFEVKAFPRLTETGAWRVGTQYGHSRTKGRIVPPPHGGYYSQADCREIVAYAAERHIEVVPEIEMPGHAQAALAAYPHLACVDTPPDVSCRWGVHKNVFNPGKDEVFDFLETVLDETMAVFPSPYIHIGGDECPKDQWEANALCQERMRTEGLKNGDELQSWFVRRIEAFLNKRGRNLVGWDEILEGGLPPNATVMSWRGIEGGVAAARAGHDVIMTPNQALYFDYYQGNPKNEPLAIGGDLPIETVYAYEPVPTELTPEESRHVLGVQANVWTEYMPDFRQVQYMTLPRAAALAEIAWSNPASRDFAEFEKRLKPVLGQYDARQWVYR